MSYLHQPPDYIAFSTTTLLTNGQTYDSGVISLIGYTQVQTDVLSNKNGTVTIQFCSDSGGTDVVRTLSILYIGGSGYQMFSAPAFSPYVRYQFTVTETGQTDFYFDTKLLTKALSPQVLGVDAFISSSMASTLTRSVIVGKTHGNYWNSISSSEDGTLDVHIARPSTAFGELLTSNLTPVVQVDFVYGLNTRTTTTAVTGSGEVTSANNMAVVSTTATSGSIAKLYTNRYVKYRAGQGALGRFTALFTTGVTGTKQYAGLATPSLDNGFMFGYDGETFGIWVIKDNSQTHIPQTAWNVDVMNGSASASNKSGATLNPIKGNVYSIQYQYLGFGKIEFFIEVSYGDFILVHRIDYANNFEVPSIGQPSLNLVLYADNGGVNSNITIKSASMAGFLQGERSFLGPRWGTNNNKNASLTELNIFTIKNCTTYNGKTNRSLVRIRNISFGSNGGTQAAAIITLRLITNTTLGGSPAFSPISGSTADDGVTITNGLSVISTDTDGTTTSGGTTIYNQILAVGNSNSLDVTDLDIFLRPGDTLTFACTASSTAGSPIIGISAVWNEDI